MSLKYELLVYAILGGYPLKFFFLFSFSPLFSFLFPLLSLYTRTVQHTSKRLLCHSKMM